MMHDGRPLLTVEHMTVVYETNEGLAKALNDVSLSIYPGQILGVVGESGSGKSTLASAIMRLLPSNASMVTGRVLIGDSDLYAIPEARLRFLRWKKFSMVFQSALATLNPVITVGQQFGEIFRIHEPAMSRKAIQDRMEELLNLVRIHRQHLGNYPHELSGGMRQRLAIAMAIALDPDLVIMDEPTTALDAVVQHEILEEIRRIQQDKKFAVLFISHDLRLVSYISSEIMVIYAGRVVETGPTQAFLSSTLHHPYSQGLLTSIPQLTGGHLELQSIPGSPPDLLSLPPGCAFRLRCSYAREECIRNQPEIKTVRTMRIACFDVEERQKEGDNGQGTIPVESERPCRSV